MFPNILENVNLRNFEIQGHEKKLPLSIKGQLSFDTDGPAGAGSLSATATTWGHRESATICTPHCTPLCAAL